MPLIVIEGMDGSGKTTQLERLSQRLSEAGCQVRHFRDPGGTSLGESLRQLLLDPEHEVCELAELFGYLLSRAQLVHSCIRPALQRQEVVLLDRFWYSTLAYQCFGLGLERQRVEAAINLAHSGVRVDCPLFLDLHPQQALARRAAASSLDRIEQRGLAYLSRVYQGYRSLVEEGQLWAIDASQGPEQIHAAIWQACQGFLA